VTFDWLIADRKGNIRMPGMIAPITNTGLRPKRSAAIAHRGIAINATTLVRIATQSIVLRGM